MTDNPTYMRGSLTYMTDSPVYMTDNPGNPENCSKCTPLKFDQFVFVHLPFFLRKFGLYAFTAFFLAVCLLMLSIIAVGLFALVFLSLPVLQFLEKGSQIIFIVAIYIICGTREKDRGMNLLHVVAPVLGCIYMYSVLMVQRDLLRLHVSAIPCSTETGRLMNGCSL